MFRQQEKVIREKRTNEAIRHNLMGPAGKFGVILQAFGHIVNRQGTGLADASYLSDPYADEVPTRYETTASGQPGPVASRDEIPEMEDEYVYNEGLLFDGLSRSMHLEIVYWHATAEMKVSYRGYLVYREVAGELTAYAPFEAWESMVERLYKAAKEKVRKLKKMREEELSEVVMAKKRSFWQELRHKWGV